VVTVWNELGGLEWAGLPMVLVRHGIEDHADEMIAGLVAIRDFQREQQRGA